jgi:hypothetical protein
MTSQVHEDRPAVPGGRGRGPGSRLAALSRWGRCPVRGCRAQLDPSRLMCRDHWYLVPKPLRDQVWATWRSGEGVFSPEHREAVRMAIASCQAASFPAADGEVASGGGG